MPNNTWSDAVWDPIQSIAAAMRAVQSPPRARASYTPAQLEALPVVMRIARADHGMSVKAAALSIGVARSTWWNWENAGIVPDAKRIPLVAKRFGIEPVYLRAALRAARARQGPARGPRGTTAPDELTE